MFFFVTIVYVKKQIVTVISIVMSDPITKFAYQTLQRGKISFAVAHKTLSAQLLKAWFPPTHPKSQPISPELLRQIQQRLEQLLETDWQDAERGIYPTELLFDHPWEDFLAAYPQVCLDIPQTWERANQKNNQEFSTGIDTTGYPSYYVQNFHHQTDGYLSDQSANLYDLQVELLFNGSADAMRRRILAPLKQGIQQRFAEVPAKEIRVLDVACGTGRTLQFIRGMLPKAALYGVDLSAAYLRKANQWLSKIPGELPQLLQANAEDLPYRNDYFHAVSSVFLFHELPPSARQQVINECYRVTQPGGVFIICDSIQAIDSPELKPLMANFSSMFHEPYYNHYITDDLVARLKTAGFTEVHTDIHFMSKYWIAHKPV